MTPNNHDLSGKKKETPRVKNFGQTLETLKKQALGLRTSMTRTDVHDCRGCQRNSGTKTSGWSLVPYFWRGEQKLPRGPIEAMHNGEAKIDARLKFDLSITLKLSSEEGILWRSFKARFSLVRSYWEGTSLRLFLLQGFCGIIGFVEDNDLPLLGHWEGGKRHRYWKVMAVAEYCGFERRSIFSAEGSFGWVMLYIQVFWALTPNQKQSVYNAFGKGSIWGSAEQWLSISPLSCHWVVTSRRGCLVWETPPPPCIWAKTGRFGNFSCCAC